MRLFGTDGIRGKVGEAVNGDIAYKLGNALASRAKGGTIVVGRDTRLSGAELVKYLRKGIIDGGATMANLGIVPTPIVSYSVVHSSAQFGVVITASHNDATYNGLKVFSPDGTKISSRLEEEIESDIISRLFIAKSPGKEVLCDDYVAHYKESLKEAFPDISGLNVVFDMANGALSEVGKAVIYSILGDARFIHSDAKGELINKGCGALYPEELIAHMDGADVGFAFDGDGDRIVAVTSTGKIVNGDLILYVLARHFLRLGMLSNSAVVGTIYTNMGVEKALSAEGIKLTRSDVGDSNVEIMMRRIGAKVGAERAGHVIIGDYLPTGDALYVALVLLDIMHSTGKSLDELVSIDEYPMGSYDIVTDRAREIASDSEILAYRDALLSDIMWNGRVLLRASGTEQKLRLMVECNDADAVNSIGESLKGAICSKYNID